MTDFLLDAGTNGFLVTPFDLLTTELNSLTATGGGTAVSSVGGTSGVFNQTNTSNAPQGSIWFKSGGSFTPSAGGHLDGWFLRSTDGGTTFEKNVSATSMPRPPDFVIPLFTSYASADIQWASGGFVLLPWESFKVLLQNNSGAALPSTGNKITLGPVGLKY